MQQGVDRRVAGDRVSLPYETKAECYCSCSMEGRIEDISLGGIKLKLRTYVGVGQKISICFYLYNFETDKTEPIFAICEVVRSAESDINDNYKSFGLRFLLVLPEHQQLIKKFIKQNLN